VSPSNQLRTVAQVLADPAVGDDFVIVMDVNRSDYEANGYTYVEDVVGSQCLMKRPKVAEPTPRTRPAPLVTSTKSTRKETHRA
jgi:hypothetical protein